jgi:hypothetical protein
MVEMLRDEQAGANTIVAGALAKIEGDRLHSRLLALAEEARSA